VEYAVYIVVPAFDDAERIAQAAWDVSPHEFDFTVREKSDPSQSADAELSFRIIGVGHPQEALTQALRLYAIGRREAGLPDDDKVRISLIPSPEA
jgi:hypothetical protein